MALNSDQVRLLSVEEGKTPDGKLGHTVKLGFFVQGQGDWPMLTVTWTFPKTYDDGDIVRLARSYFHEVCRDLAAATEAWKMSEEKVAALQRGTKSPFSNTAATS